jgi:2-haloalkanoic acid dehalogenase type II
VAADCIGDCGLRRLRKGRTSLSDFRYLTFDCYGTLIDWRKGIEAALNRTLGKMPMRGRELQDAYEAAEKRHESEYKSYREVLASTAGDLAAEFGMKAEPQALAKFAESVPDWPAFPDTAEALRAMGRKGYKRYILSNVDTDLLKGTIARGGLSVDGFVTAEECRSYKPAFGHWTRFMERTGARKEEILHVAQSVYHDIVPTGKLGISSAWVNRYAQPLPDGSGPLYICDSLASLVPLLGQTKGAVFIAGACGV